jgi:hypothetical protein
MGKHKPAYSEDVQVLVTVRISGSDVPTPAQRRELHATARRMVCAMSRQGSHSVVPKTARILKHQTKGKE